MRVCFSGAELVTYGLGFTIAWAVLMTFVDYLRGRL